ncbi:MAG: polysaccharide biosynthesis protein [Actinobacteria bacterium]|nr:polysaccharide biosynthesis protein [Actinomycetota bacterium]
MSILNNDVAEQPCTARAELFQSIIRQLKLTRLKQPVFLLVDAALVVIALFMSFLLRFGMSVPQTYMATLIAILPIAILTKVPVFYAFGFYQQLWQYASMKEGLRLLGGITSASFLFLGVLWLSQNITIPRGVFIIDWMLTLSLIGGSYFLIRAQKDLFPTLNFAVHDGERTQVIIVGAGAAGSGLVKQMQSSPECGYRPIAILDDDPAKNGLMIHGIEVVGASTAIPTILAKYPVDEIILAIPSAAVRDRRRIALECREIGIACKTVPDLSELVGGNISLSQIRDIDPKELLGRKEVDTDLRDTITCYKNRTVLITGAAGSIGSEICRQVVYLKPARVIATDISENGLYHLDEEMRASLNLGRAPLEINIMDVRDKHAIERAFNAYKPDIVFHAAAYKHVPMMENHMLEAMENNFVGTRNVIEAVTRHKCERFTLISTDKAVNPTSVMGLSKQLGERSVRAAASKDGGTKFMAVRFGNVLGSNGSVIPKFKRQIRDNEPITVTHREITRYFMTIQEAVYLVTQATAIGKGGEVFVLDMGEPINIYDLAVSMVRLSGFEPDEDIPIQVTGLRPGEKLYEELFAEGESINRTIHPKINEAWNEYDRVADAGFLKGLENIVRTGDEKRLARKLSDVSIAASGKFDTNVRFGA